MPSFRLKLTKKQQDLKEATTILDPWISHVPEEKRENLILTVASCLHARDLVWERKWHDSWHDAEFHKGCFVCDEELAEETKRQIEQDKKSDGP